MTTAPLTALRIHHKTMSLKQLLQRLRIDPSLADIGRCKHDLIIECWAETLGLTADRTELQTAVNRFRRSNGLYTAAQATEWLELRGMTLDDLLSLLKPQVLREVLVRHTVDEDDIRRRFLEIGHTYDRAEISTIVTSGHGAAQELRFRVEEGADFHSLAREYSSEPSTAKSGGYAGFVSRGDLEPETAAAVFNASAGALLGPFEHRHGYSLLWVEAIYPAELNETVASQIREQLFQYKLESYERTLDIHEDVWSLGEGWGT